jgi:hypothetical protein
MGGQTEERYGGTGASNAQAGWRRRTSDKRDRTSVNGDRVFPPTARNRLAPPPVRSDLGRVRRPAPAAAETGGVGKRRYIQQNAASHHRRTLRWLHTAFIKPVPRSVTTCAAAPSLPAQVGSSRKSSAVLVLPGAQRCHPACLNWAFVQRHNKPSAPYGALWWTRDKWNQGSYSHRAFVGFNLEQYYCLHLAVSPGAQGCETGRFPSNQTGIISCSLIQAIASQSRVKCTSHKNGP